MRLKFLSFATFCFILVAAPLKAQEDDLLTRKFYDMDVTAYCSFSSYHPVQYIIDDNWKILTAFITSGKIGKLDSLGIKYTESQLMLLNIGGLLQNDNGVWKTSMPIFNRQQTDSIRGESREYAELLYKRLKGDFKEFLKAVKESGAGANSFSIVFSYCLDGMIWDYLYSPKSIAEYSTWSGAFWALYSERDDVKPGTNGYGSSVLVNHSPIMPWDWSQQMFSDFDRDFSANGRLTDTTLINYLYEFGISDKKGNVLVPVLNPNADNMLNNYCKKIVKSLAEEVKQYAPTFAKRYNIKNEKIAATIFYHELMWDLVQILIENKQVTYPAILQGKATSREHLKDVTLIIKEQ